MKQIIMLLLLLLIACAPAVTRPEKFIVYKTPQCGCCTAYVEELQKQGFEVETKILDDLTQIKAQYNIPENMQSCHTSIVEGYFVEGHVPIDAVNKLLSERPQIDGIALPGMPIGSPGMPGKKKEPFRIYAITEGAQTDFMIV